jgi:hypothetical protein
MSRKSLFPIVLISMLLPSAANGQVTAGVAAGINWAGLGDVDVGSLTAAYESHQGWHVGAFADLRLAVVGVRPGVYYVNAGPLLEGGITEEQSAEEDGLASFDVTYVSIPIDLKIGLPLPILEPHLFLGPEFKFSTVSDDEGAIAEQLESTVIAGNAGVGVGVSLGSVKLYPELRIAFDISSLFGDTITIGGEEIPVDNHSASAFIARLGVGF